MALLLALLFAAPAQPAQPKADLSTGLVAVLEFRNKLKGDEQKDVDAGFLADEVRELLLQAMPGLRVITRENMIVLLQSSGKKLDECEGECEVDTGRRIGADLVVSGELLKFGSSYKLDLKLHETHEGRLVAGAIASGKSVDELDAGTSAAVAQLIGPLKPQAPAEAPAKQGLPPAVAQQATPQQPASQPAPQRPAPAQPQPGRPGRPGATQDHPIMRREERSGLEFVRVLDGSAHLGCAIGDSSCAANEKPAREVGIGGFWIGRTEVTTGAFAACAKARACSNKPQKRDVKATGACNWHNRRFNHPINCVTWDEAVQFCRWVGGRLPTAIEWEFAARSGDDVIYPWGDGPVTGTRANFCDVNCERALIDRNRGEHRADRTIDDGWAATAPVGSYRDGANKWGLFDMAGNVAEWTASTSGNKGDKEIRGGSWATPARSLRASHRGNQPANKNEAGLGFRCAL